MVGGLRPRWIDSPVGVVEVADRCRRAGSFAFDTEADSLHSYFHKVCLVQVSADGMHALVDPLAVAAGDLQPLWDVVGDPELPVLMHGADYDIRVLDRDFGARVRGLEDTQIMAQLLGEAKTGLAALLARDVGVQLEKKHQRADWGRRPLGAELENYAAADTAYLAKLAAGLRRRLAELGRWRWAEEEFRRLESVRFQPPEADEYAFERVKGSGRLRGAARDRFAALHAWREDRARALDVPPFKVLGNAPMLDLAERPVERLDELSSRGGVGPRITRRWGKEILARLSAPPAAPPRRKPSRPPPLSEAVRRRLELLTAVRDGEAARLGLPTGLVCPNAIMLAVASIGGVPDDDALRAAGLDGWRADRLGEAFRDVLRGGDASG